MSLLIPVIGAVIGWAGSRMQQKAQNKAIDAEMALALQLGAPALAARNAALAYYSARLGKPSELLMAQYRVGRGRMQRAIGTAERTSNVKARRFGMNPYGTGWREKIAGTEALSDLDLQYGGAQEAHLKSIADALANLGVGAGQTTQDILSLAAQRRLAGQLPFAAVAGGLGDIQSAYNFEQMWKRLNPPEAPDSNDWTPAPKVDWGTDPSNPYLDPYMPDDLNYSEKAAQGATPPVTGSRATSRKAALLPTSQGATGFPTLKQPRKWSRRPLTPMRASA